VRGAQGPESASSEFSYFFAFAHRFFCAADIFALAAADITRFPDFTGTTCPLLPFKAAIAASTPANCFVSVVRSSW
jgi:hypothetical protein